MSYQYRVDFVRGETPTEARNSRGSGESSYDRRLFYRQRHQYGNEQVLKMMQRHFRVPEANASTASAAATAPGSSAGRNQSQLFADYLWLTQLQQARCYETAFTQWRRQRSRRKRRPPPILVN